MHLGAFALERARFLLPTSHLRGIGGGGLAVDKAGKGREDHGFSMRVRGAKVAWAHAFPSRSVRGRMNRETTFCRIRMLKNFCSVYFFFFLCLLPAAREAD